MSLYSYHYIIFSSFELSIQAMENTRLLKTYTEIDSRVSELGYMIKHLAKVCKQSLICLSHLMIY
jgi:DNA polymerase sigma